METKEYIVSAFTENAVGVLIRITAAFMRRKVNIESIKVSHSSIEGVSVFTIVAHTTQETIENIVRQIRRIVDVIKADYYVADNVLSQEIALFKVNLGIFEDQTIEQIASHHTLRVIDITPECVILRKTGFREEISALAAELKERGLLIQVSRSGSVILYDEPSEKELFGME